MYKLKSAIILKDRIFIPDYDSHSQMLEELNIADTRENAERLFVRAELSPANGDVFTPVDEWVFKVDQDIRPDWFVENYEKERMISAVKEWAKGHIHIGVNGLKISSGSGHYIKGCKDVEICGNSTIENVYGNSTIKNVCGNSVIIGSPYGWRNKDKFIISENATFKDNQAKIIYQAGDWEVRLIDKEKSNV